MNVVFDTNVITDTIADQDKTNVAQTLFMAAAELAELFTDYKTVDSD